MENDNQNISWEFLRQKFLKEEARERQKMNALLEAKATTGMNGVIFTLLTDYATKQVTTHERNNKPFTAMVTAKDIGNEVLFTVRKSAETNLDLRPDEEVPLFAVSTRHEPSSPEKSYSFFQLKTRDCGISNLPTLTTEQDTTTGKNNSIVYVPVIARPGFTGQVPIQLNGQDITERPRILEEQIQKLGSSSFDNDLSDAKIIEDYIARNCLTTK